MNGCGNFLLMLIFVLGMRHVDSRYSLSYMLRVSGEVLVGFGI